MRLRLTLPAALTSLVAVAALSVTAPAAHAATARPPAPRCADTDLLPTADDLPAIRTALLCLHNQERISRGLHPLAGNARLQATADGHSTEMVNDGYFAHASADGTSFSARIIRGGYVARNADWTLGENLAWATGDLATPTNLMDAWMHSPEHRANILTRAYRDIGIGMSFGGTDTRLTVTADFGARG
jgi:uncharacterized protein YkwD